MDSILSALSTLPNLSDEQKLSVFDTIEIINRLFAHLKLEDVTEFTLSVKDVVSLQYLLSIATVLAETGTAIPIPAEDDNILEITEFDKEKE